jgi:hypothetical protein
MMLPFPLPVSPSSHVGLVKNSEQWESVDKKIDKASRRLMQCGSRL